MDRFSFMDNRTDIILLLTNLVCPPKNNQNYNFTWIYFRFTKYPLQLTCQHSSKFSPIRISGNFSNRILGFHFPVDFALWLSHPFQFLLPNMNPNTDKLVRITTMVATVTVGILVWSQEKLAETNSYFSGLVELVYQLL